VARFSAVRTAPGRPAPATRIPQENAGRDEFQRLIAKVEAGADFEAVLVRDVSRWSRAENTDEAGFYEFICRRAGVEVIYVDESFAPDCSPSRCS
jgi:DNA invertase Pin-like site-specific DNA recombinase